MKRAVAIALVFVVRINAARADGPLGANGSDIRTSNYAVDLAAGPVLGGPRVIGLGGAYVAIAEGINGNTQNPAAPAVRQAWSSRHFAFDATLGLVYPATLTRTDYFNTGHRTDLSRSDPRDFALLAPAANFQFGNWGVGVGLFLQRFGLLRRSDPATGGADEPVRAQITTFHVYVARAVDDGQLVAGLGLHLTALDVKAEHNLFTRSGNLFTSAGANFETGLVWKPSNQPYRAGFALRAPATTRTNARGGDEDGDTVLRDPQSPDAIWMPKRVKRPWSSDVGVAVQLGPRPLNVPFVDADEIWPDDEQRREQLKKLVRERYKSFSRRYVLIAASLHVDGDVENSVGIESFLSGKVDRSGERVGFSPRLGVETEAIEDWLKVRAGSYAEPSRFRDPGMRYHATAGFDVKLIPTRLFGLLQEDSAIMLSAAIDRARDYLGWAASLGIWH